MANFLTAFKTADYADQKMLSCTKVLAHFGSCWLFDRIDGLTSMVCHSPLLRKAKGRALCPMKAESRVEPTQRVPEDRDNAFFFPSIFSSYASFATIVGKDLNQFCANKDGRKPVKNALACTS